MITSFCNSITDIFLKRNIIESDEKEVYQYGLEIFISTIIGFTIVLIIGLIFKSFFESLLFYLCFATIRVFSGGYHASTYFRCKISFGLILTAVLGLTNIFYIFSTNLLIMIPIQILNLIIIYKLAPIRNINKPLDLKKIKSYKTLSIFIYFLWLAISFIFSIWQIRFYWIINVTICSVVCLIIIGKIQEKRRVVYETE